MDFIKGRSENCVMIAESQNTGLLKGLLMAHNCITNGSWFMVKGSKFNADDNNNDNLDDGRWLKKNKCCEGMQ